MTHEPAPARRDPGGRHGDGPGAFPSEQHLPPLHSGPWRPACWAGFVLWIWGELVLVGMPAVEGERVRVRLG